MRIGFWIKNARSISLPQSALPCLTAIVLCIGQEGFVWWLAFPIILGVCAVHLGMNLADTPSFSPLTWLVIIPFIAAASQWFTMWITRKVNGNGMQMGGDDAQAQMSMKMMDLVMPLMTVFFAFSFSGMLGVYWIYQSLLSIVQTLILAKVMPIPKFTEEDIKAIRKAEKEQEKINREIMKSQPKFRSLHYIDEDDYDELPTVKKNNQNSNKPKSNDIPEIKD